MAYFPDLSPYEYFRDCPGLINIGWLDFGHPFTVGKVSVELVRKIGELCMTPSNLCRGFHYCWWCGPVQIKEDLLEDGVLRLLGNGEIHVSAGGIDWVYSAPTMIYHYIVRHGYLPPQEFLHAVERLIG